MGRGSHRPFAVSAGVAALGALAGVLAVYQTAGIVHGRHRLADLVRGQVERHLAGSSDQSVLDGVTAALIVGTAAVVVALVRAAVLLARGSRPAWRAGVGVLAVLLAARVAAALAGAGNRFDDAVLPDRAHWVGAAGIALTAVALVALCTPAARRWNRAGPADRRAAGAVDAPPDGGAVAH